jgi:hypothetical protein
MAEGVAQTCSLLYRRLAVCQADPLRLGGDSSRASPPETIAVSKQLRRFRVLPTVRVHCRLSATHLSGVNLPMLALARDVAMRVYPKNWLVPQPTAEVILPASPKGQV